VSRSCDSHVRQYFTAIVLLNYFSTGIKYIVDAGFVKLKYFDPVAGVDALLTSPISKASAIQRLGRAGRTQPGKCYRC
jgi:HrpA-like RNA helicase